MPKLIEQILENSNKIKSKSVFLGDGSSDSNENFKFLQNKRIRPSAIKVRKNSIISSKKKNNNAWNREVKFQTREIFSNGRRKEIIENDGLLKLFFHL